MTCCNATFERCNENGETVIGIFDAEAGTTVYINANGTTYTGDVALLGSCIQLPESECCEFVYVEYDPDIHVPGTVVGTGTTTSPFQIPLPPQDDPLDPLPEARTHLVCGDIDSGRSEKTGQIVALGSAFNRGTTTSQNTTGGIAGTGTVWTQDPDGSIETGGIQRYGESTFALSPTCDVCTIAYTTNWVDNNPYTYQSGRNNTSINAANDPLFFDGTRVQTAHLEPSTLYSLGDEVWHGVSTASGPWLQANDSKLLWQWHASDSMGVGLRPYLALYIQNGVIRLVSHTDTSTTPTNNTLTATTHWSASAAAYVDVNHDFVINFKHAIDGTGFLNVWMRTGTGAWTQIVAYVGNIGFDVSGYGAAFNSQNYLAESYYQWHGDSTSHYNPTDLTYPLRTVDWLYSKSWSNEPTISSFTQIADDMDASFVCVPDVPTDSTMGSRTTQIGAGVAFEEFCAGCPAIWETRVLDSLADEFIGVNPVGDRVDPDPGNPGGWVSMPTVDGETCVRFSIDEILDGETAETFYFEVRSSCDGGSTWQYGSVRMES